MRAALNTNRDEVFEKVGICVNFSSSSSSLSIPPLSQALGTAAPFTPAALIPPLHHRPDLLSVSDTSGGSDLPNPPPIPLVESTIPLYPPAVVISESNTSHMIFSASPIDSSNEFESNDDNKKQIFDYESSLSVFSFNSSASIPLDVAPTEHVTAEPCPICCEILGPIISAHEVLLECNADTKIRTRTVQCPGGHAFCLGCWRMHLQLQVREDTAKALNCPAYKCGERLCQMEWEKAILVEDALVDRLRSSRLAFIVDCSRQLQRCPGSDCGLALCIEIKQPAVCKRCGVTLYQSIEAIESHVCASRGSGTVHPEPSPSNTTVAAACMTAICGNGHSCCMACSMAAHAPCSCETYSKWTKKVATELKHLQADGAASGAEGGSSIDIANALWLTANCKRCPRCQTPIEKDEGCNHMACRKCRYEFCWICMQNWSLHSNSTGGYFQCNRFVNDPEVSSSIRDSSSNNSGRKAEGNAHEETMRMRRQGENMAKFIHYYTRYRAHGDSAQLEARIRKETVMRIKVRYLSPHLIISCILSPHLIISCIS